MVQVAWFVEHVYPLLVPIVILAATYVIVLKRERSLVIPFIIALFLVSAVFYGSHWWGIFFISLPSMFITLWIPVVIAWHLAYIVRWMLRRSVLGR
jgi:hypothetical protein